MGPLIDKLAALAAGVSGIRAVHQDARQGLTVTPAAVIEAVCEGEQWERELGGAPLRLELRLSLNILAALPAEPGEVAAARDQVLALARACRTAIAADPTLDGGCLGSLVKRTDFSYVTTGGQDYAQALTLIEAVKEQSL
ncbi:MAG: hypothetical protein V1797_03805 [Pseudomonadota bacterium]